MSTAPAPSQPSLAHYRACLHEFERACRDLAQDGTTPSAIAGLHRTLHALVAARQPLAARDGRLAGYDRGLAERIEQSLMPPLARAILAAAPAPGEILAAEARQGLFLELIGLLKTLIENGAKACGQRVGAAAYDRVVHGLSHAIDFFYRTTAGQLEAGDFPDLKGLSQDFLRLDVLYWALELLEADGATAAARVQAAVLTRAAMRRTVAIGRDYLHRRSPEERFSLAAALKDVEELLTLAARIAEADAAARDEARSAGVAPILGEPIVAEFLALAPALAETVMADVRRRIVLKAVSPAAAEGNLRQVAAVLRFCRLAGHHGAESALADAARRVRAEASESFEVLRGRLASSFSAAEATRARALLRALESFIAGSVRAAAGDAEA